MLPTEPDSGSVAAKAPYTALYRRWRPQLFSQVLGQEHVTRTLQNALVGNRIAHAYLFCGLRGTGKTTMAKLLGKTLNCLEGVNAEPCNRCRSCVEVTEGRNLDVLEIDAASNRGIDEIRDLREKVRYAAAQNRYKVYIIDEVHMLTPEAFNALLKVLEEPPPLVVFILATTEVHKIPLTIVSRCQRYDFHLLEVTQLAGRLRAVADDMHFTADDKTLILLARQAEGAVRDALGLLEQCRAYGGESITYEQALEILGLPAPAILHRYYQAVIDEDLGSGMTVIREVVQRGMDLQRLLREQLLYLRKLLLLQAGQDETAVLMDVPALKSYLLQHRDKFDAAVILEMLEILQQLTYQLRGASQPQFLLEMVFLRLARVYRFRAYFSPGELVQRLEALEEKLLTAGKGRLASAEVVENKIMDKINITGQTPATMEPGNRGEKEKQPEVAETEILQQEEMPSPQVFMPADKAESADPLRPLQKSEEANNTADPGAQKITAAADETNQTRTTAEDEMAATVELNNEPVVTPRGEAAFPAGGLTLFWQEQFLAQLRKDRRHNLLAYLIEAVPLSLKGGIFAISISPRHAYLKKRLEAEKNRKYMEDMLQQLLGTPVTFRIILEEPVSEASGKPAESDRASAARAPQGNSHPTAEAPAGTNPTAPPTDTKDDFMPQVLELFQGRLIEAGSDREDNGEKRPLASGDYWADGEPIPSPPDEDEEEI